LLINTRIAHAVNSCGTFDDVLDVSPVGYYVERVLWRAAGFHDGRLLRIERAITSNEGVTKIVIGERFVRHEA
jgi:hypothetical protein